MGRKGLSVIVSVWVACLLGWGAVSASARPSVRTAFRTPSAMCAGSDTGEHFASNRIVPFCITGTVVTRYRGSRAAGCASRGVCGYTGVIRWQPGGGDLLVTRHGGALRTTTALGGPRGPTVVVRRTVAERVRGTCRRRVGPIDSLGSPTAIRHGTARITLPRAGGNDTWAVPCAGPVQADLPAPVVVSVPLQRALHGVTRTSVTSTRRFSHDGWAGTVSARLRVIAGPQQRGAPGPPPSKSRQRVVTVTYRAAAPVGGVTLDYAHGRPGCAALDACGLQGTVRMHAAAGARPRRLILRAIGPVNRPAVDFLTALGLTTGGDTQGIGTGGAQVGGTPMRVSATTTQGGTRCTGTGTGAIGFTLLGSQTLIAFNDGVTDLLRTICPGPSLAVQSLGLITLAPGQLDSSHPSLDFTAAPAWHADGYQVQVQPHLTVALTRISVTNRVISEPGR